MKSGGFVRLCYLGWHRSMKFHASLYSQGHISGILAGFLISLGLFMWFSNVIFYIALFWYARRHTTFHLSVCFQLNWRI
jgi:hypothetical protein